MNLPDYFRRENRRAELFNLYYMIYMALCLPIAFYLVFSNDNSYWGEMISWFMFITLHVWFVALLFVKDKD